MKYLKIVLLLILFISFAKSEPNCTLENCGEPIGPGGGGTMSRVIASPHQTNVIYAANDMGGIFKSYDNGNNWNYLSRQFYGQSIVNMVLHPSDSNIIYVQSLTNVCKSTNGGKTWQLLTALHQENVTPNKPYIISTFKLYEEVRRLNALAIDPKNPNTIYISGNYGFDSSDSIDYRKYYIYKSTDAGITWNILPNDTKYLPPKNSFFQGVITSIVVDPKNSNIIYVSNYYGFYKSIDGGQTWVQSNTGLPLEPLPMSRSIKEIISNEKADKYKGASIYDLNINPNNSDTMFVLTRTHGVYKTINGGLFWFSSNDNNLKNSLTPYDSISGYKSEDNTPLSGCLRMSLDNPNKLALSISKNKVLWESSDAGKTWNNILSLWPTSFQTSVSKDFPYSEKQRSYLTCQFGDCAGPKVDLSFVKGDPNTLFGASDWGIERYSFDKQNRKLTERALLWKGLYTITSQGQGTSISSLGNSQKIYMAGMDCSLMKTSDNGNQWISMLTPEIWTIKDTWLHLNSIVAIPSTPPTIFFSGFQKHFGSTAYKSIDDGNSWIRLTKGLPKDVLAFCRQVLPDKDYLSNQIVYLVYDSSGVFKSIDGGNLFNEINTGLPKAGLSFGDGSLAIDPNNNLNLYLVLKRPTTSFYTSSNGGKNWEMKSFNNGYGDPLGGVTVIYYKGIKIIYVSCQYGIWMSNDEGNTWKKSFDVSEICQDIKQYWIRDLPLTKVVESKTQSGRLFFMVSNWLGIPRMSQQGIYTSSDAGATWSKLFETPNFGGNFNISDDSKYLLQFSGGMGIWKYKLPDSLTVSVENDELNYQEKTGFYPNVFHDNSIFQLQIEEDFEYLLTIYDLFGRINSSYKITSPQTKISLPNYQNGIYFYKVTKNKEYYSSGKFMLY
ncbi:MAG: T9SS type A sorting domain-containing protein [Candidatus Kapabacteria bacterium]|nr:T9SS type A sorting domain-containing protein [Candidatus Kapabacteria bacterium]